MKSHDHIQFRCLRDSRASGLLKKEESVNRVQWSTSDEMTVEFTAPYGNYSLAAGDPRASVRIDFYLNDPAIWIRVTNWANRLPCIEVLGDARLARTRGELSRIEYIKVKAAIKAMDRLEKRGFSGPFGFSNPIDPFHDVH